MMFTTALSRWNRLLRLERVAATTLSLLVGTFAPMPVRAQIPENPTPIARAVRPGVDTLLSIRTTPEAVCTLYSEKANDPQRRLHLDADDQGIVRLYAKASGASQPVSLSLTCTAADGRVATYPVAIGANANAPLPAPELPTARAAGQALRPPLEGDLTALSNQELVARGYPPRPEPTTAPGAYARWQKIVSVPFTAVHARKVPHFDISFAPEQAYSPTLPVPPPSSRPTNRQLGLPPSAKVVDTMANLAFGNWSGAYMTNPDVKYWLVESDWNVPRVNTLPSYLSYAAAAEWIGLDNAGNDLVQSGTDSESFNFYFFGNVWSFTAYSTWIESLPNAPYFLPNFPTSPGDEISLDIFLADPNGNVTFSNGDLTPSDNTVWFMIYNMTTHQSYWGTLPKPAAFSGSTVDFVVERPSQNGSLTSLANFGLASMHDCWFADSWFGWSSLDYNGATPNVGVLNDITMYNFSDNQTLASSYIYANWDSPGGGNVLWVWQNYN